MTESNDQPLPADSDEEESAPIGDGTDVTAEEQELEGADTPATSDPDKMTDDGSLGGVGGENAGGAG